MSLEALTLFDDVKRKCSKYSRHSITASKVIVIFKQVCAYLLCTKTFEFDSFLSKKIVFSKKKRKSEVTTAVFVQMKANQQHLLGFWCFFQEIMLCLMNICRPILWFC